MGRFFISFAAEDAVLARFVHQALSKAFKGKAFFFVSTKEIAPSTKWKEKIKAEIGSASAGLFLLTQS